MNQQSGGQQELPRTTYLDHTLRRARTAAEQRSHRYVTLEHLLLSLLDDPDAANLLQVTGADAAAIHGAVADAVNNRMASLVVPGATKASFSYRFGFLFQCANEDAISLGRRQIDGALALVAVAKEAESNASGILAANGFSPRAALEAMKASRPVQPAKTAPPPARSANGKSHALATGQISRPIFAAEAVSLPAGDETIDDIITSVRSILQAEELKERQLSERGAPASRLAPPKPKEALVNLGECAANAGSPEPWIGPSPADMRLSTGASRVNGFSEASAPAFDLETVPKPEKKNLPPPRPVHRGKAGNTALLAKLFEPVPRKARVGVSEKVQITLSKEMAVLIFAHAVRRQPQPGTGSEACCRAVTIRLASPEGEFLVDALTAETQWLPERPREDASATWIWTLVPGVSGSACLKASISAREVDANGASAAIALPDQVIKVRVRANLWLSLSRFFRAMFWMFLGSGLTLTVWYALTFAGKLH